MIYIIDVETTGVTAKDQVIELAWIKLNNDISTLEPLESFQQYFNPSVPIHPRASEVHGLTKNKLIHFPRAGTIKLPEDIQIGIFHNAVFDMRMLTYPAIKVICTLKLVKKIEKVQKIKIGEDHKLRTLFTLFYPDISSDFMTIHHGAEADCKMTLGVLIALLKFLPLVETLEDLERFLK